MTFFPRLLEMNRLFTVLHDNLADAVKADPLYHSVNSYLEKYTAYNSISPEMADSMYTRYITAFNKHCKQFIKTGKYPFENGTGNYEIGREEYDIVLLLSVLLTPHRFRIMELIANAGGKGKALFIGLGPGLGIILTRQMHTEISGYDLSVSPFLLSEFPGITLRTELYTGQYTGHFDTIYLIELLEHIPDPIELLRICYSSLEKGGRVILTTATDIPQFDHLYNFPDDHSKFEEALESIGFSIIQKEKIPHNYLTMELKPSNHFYIIEK